MNKPSSRPRSFLAGAACVLLLASSAMALSITKPMPFADAVRRVEEKTAVASTLRTKDWQNDVPLALRERSFFSAAVSDARTVSSMRDKVGEALDLSSRDRDRAFMSRDKFIADMRGELGAQEGDSGRLTDITSQRRLGLVYDFNVEDAMEFGRFRQSQDPESLDAAPCQELVRVESREQERNWKKIWQDAGGSLTPDGRMIARKDDGIWTRISDFGRPWPPFKFGSGMGVDDVFRDEAEELGIITPDDVVAPTLQDFNDRLEADVAKLSPTAKTSLLDRFGEQLVLEGDKLRWDNDALGRIYDVASDVANKKPDARVSLGRAWAQTVAVGKRDLGLDLDGWSLEVRASEVRHALRGHGARDLIAPGSGETRADQEALTKSHVRAIPLVWRAPDGMKPGGPAPAGAPKPAKGWPPSIQMQADIGGRLYVANYVADHKARRLRAVSAWKKAV